MRGISFQLINIRFRAGKRTKGILNLLHLFNAAKLTCNRINSKLHAT